MAGGPLWLRAVHRLERAVGERVEAAVHSDPYFDFVALAQRRQRQAKELAESVSRRTLHLLNLPAGSDVRRLREQLNRMDRRLSRLAKELEESDPGDTVHAAEADPRQ
jgi:hypothetical protein